MKTPRRVCEPTTLARRSERLVSLRRSLNVVILFAAVAAASVVDAQEPSARQIAEERAQAEFDAPKLVEVLELKPGMTVADIGAGGGAMTVVLGKNGLDRATCLPLTSARGSSGPFVSTRSARG